MESHHDLLNQARPHCDASTGEVVQRLPDELMQQLRAAKLTRGVPGPRNNRTQTAATWFVFFTDQIRNRVLLELRDANRKRGRKVVVNSTEQHSTGSVQSVAQPTAQRGLAQFRQTRRAAK